VEWLQETVARLRASFHDARAVFLAGSHARGDHGPWSDVDLTLVLGRPRRTGFIALWPEVDGRPLHVSVDLTTKRRLLDSQRRPAKWSLGLPARQVVRVLWAADPDLDGLTELRHPAGRGELEDFLECAGKVMNARRRGDEFALRIAARGLAERWPALVAPLNPPVLAESPLHAWRLALAFPDVPAQSADDVRACLGLRPVAGEEVYRRAMRLAAETVGELRRALEAGNPLAWLGLPDLRPPLRDGTVLRAFDDFGGAP
jgi:predicted nucleotidyltransferase